MRVLQCVLGGFSTIGLDRIVYKWGDAVYKDGIIFDYICRFYYEDDCVQNINSIGGIVSYPNKTRGRLSKRIEKYKRLRSLNQQFHYRIIHIHSPRAHVLLEEAVMARLAGINKIILHSHSSGLDFGLSKSSKSKHIKQIFLHHIAKISLPLFADSFCACSEKAADWMFWGHARRETKIIYNAFKADSFQYNDVQRKHVREVNNMGESIIVGHVGRFTYQKNHEFILFIAEEAKKNGLNMRFELIGDGDDIDIIKEKVRGKGLDNIDFIGKTAEVGMWMQAFDVFILPSHFEGLPVAGLEAQIAGLPCIFSDQIDRQAKIADATLFLPINQKASKKWCSSIVELSKTDRQNNIKSIRLEVCDMKKTVLALEQLYFE